MLHGHGHNDMDTARRHLVNT